MARKSAHGREPEPLDEILECLAYVQAVRQGDDEAAMSTFDSLHLRLAGRPDAMVPPLKLASLIVAEAERQQLDIEAVLTAVREQALAEFS